MLDDQPTDTTRLLGEGRWRAADALGIRDVGDAVGVVVGVVGSDGGLGPPGTVRSIPVSRPMSS